MTKSLKSLTLPKAARLAATRANTVRILNERRQGRPMIDLTISEIALVFSTLDRVGITTVSEVADCLVAILKADGFNDKAAKAIAHDAEVWADIEPRGLWQETASSPDLNSPAAVARQLTKRHQGVLVMAKKSTSPKASKPAAKAPAATPTTAAGTPDLDLGDAAPAATETVAPGVGVAMAPAEGTAPASTEPMFPIADGFDVINIPADQITLNPSRVPTDADVVKMAKSIKERGLHYAPVIGADFQIVSGNKRFLAMKDKLGWKVIPCRVAVDIKGNQVKASEAEGILQAIAENLQRSNPTPSELARSFDAAIKAGVAPNAKDLAPKVGMSAAMISRIMSISERGCPEIHEALAAGTITNDAAAAIIARTTDAATGKPDHKAQLELLTALLTASEGKKITIEHVDSKKPANAASARGRQAGRPASRRSIGADACNSDESGTHIVLHKGDKKGQWRIVVETTIAVEADTFSRLDILHKVAAAHKKIDGPVLRKALEEAREALV